MNDKIISFQELRAASFTELICDNVKIVSSVDPEAIVTDSH